MRGLKKRRNYFMDTTKKYTWAEKDADEWRNPNFDTVEAALADAVRNAIAEAIEGDRIGMAVVVWDLRPATPADRDLFEGCEEFDVDDEPNWWEACWVPENDVWRGTVSPAGWVGEITQGVAK